MNWEAVKHRKYRVFFCIWHNYCQAEFCSTPSYPQTLHSWRQAQIKRLTFQLTILWGFVRNIGPVTQTSGITSRNPEGVQGEWTKIPHSIWHGRDDLLYDDVAFRLSPHFQLITGNWTVSIKNGLPWQLNSRGGYRDGRDWKWRTGSHYL